MENNNAIEVHNIKKKFKVYYDKGNSLKEKVIFKERNHYEDRWVLNGIDLSVKRGEAIGLIGKNGCGKSTLLKLLNKIMYPDEGNIEIRGRVSSLIELGAGFHPDMSGRENIYTNASIFGLARKEIDERMDSIVTFSELEDFLDNPVRTYSSGMYMRLAFSIAINVDADVLLIDEILAVGDVSFQTKCFEKLKKIKANGTTIVIVSHSLMQIEQICERTLWIENGLVKEEGIPKYVHDHYLSSMEEKRLDRINEEEKKKDIQIEELNNKEKVVHEDKKLPSFCRVESIRMGNKTIEFTEVKFLDNSFQSKKIFNTGEKIFIKMYYESKMENIKANFGIGIFRDDGVHCYGTHIMIEKNNAVNIRNKGWVEVEIPQLLLLPGSYTLDIGVISEQGEVFDEIHGVAEFRMVSPKRDSGVSRIDTLWKIDGMQL